MLFWEPEYKALTEQNHVQVVIKCSKSLHGKDTGRMFSVSSWWEKTTWAGCSSLLYSEKEMLYWWDLMGQEGLSSSCISGGSVRMLGRISSLTEWLEHLHRLPREVIPGDVQEIWRCGTQEHELGDNIDCRWMVGLGDLRCLFQR